MKKDFPFPRFLAATIIASVIIFLITTSANAKYKYENPLKRSFYKASKNIILTCPAPCPFLKKKLQPVPDRLEQDLQTLETKAQIKLPESLKPFEVHLTFDKICRDISSRWTNDKRAMGFTTRDLNGKGIICLNINFHDLNDVLEGKSGFVHELAHHYFLIPQKNAEKNIEEDLVGAIVGLVAGRQTSMCDNIYKKYEPRIYKLCNKYGFDFKHIPALLRRIGQMRSEGTILTNQLIIEEIKKLGGKTTAPTSLPNPQ